MSICNVCDDGFANIILPFYNLTWTTFNGEKCKCYLSRYWYWEHLCTWLVIRHPFCCRDSLASKDYKYLPPSKPKTCICSNLFYGNICIYNAWRNNSLLLKYFMLKFSPTSKCVIFVFKQIKFKGNFWPNFWLFFTWKYFRKKVLVILLQFFTPAYDWTLFGEQRKQAIFLGDHSTWLKLFGWKSFDNFNI